MKPALNSLLSAKPGASDEEQRRYEMLQAGLDLLDQGLTVFDADLRMVAWNRTFLRLLDFPPEMAYIGAPFDSFIRYNAERGEYGPGDTNDIVAAIVERARSFMPHSADRQRPNGRILAVRGLPLPHRGFITLYTDVTEQRHHETRIAQQKLELEVRVGERTAELKAANAQLTEANATNLEIAASLRRSEARLRLITDRVPANIGYFDHQLIFRYANQGYSDWFSMPVDRIVGHSTASVLGPLVWPTIRDNVARALSGVQVSYEYSLTRPDGRPVFARSTLVPEFSPDGRVLGCFVLALDVTEQKRTQAALVQAQKMEAIGQLTGGIAHDFNNMLTVVIGNLTVLRDWRALGHAANNGGPNRDGVYNNEHHEYSEYNEYLNSALQASRRGVDLIKRLLAFSRQQPLAPQTVDIGLLVQEMAKLMRRSLPETIALTCFVGEHNLIARADPNQLDSALLNLVLNARDAMPHGGLIRIELGQVRLDGASAREQEQEQELPPGSYVSITVTDNGLGMDSATLARVFEPFFTTKDFGKGSGLGMAMVYGFVKQSGGSAKISSSPGKGTSVTLLLPGMRGDDAVLDLPETSDNLRSDTEKLVLLVEDDPDVRKIVRRQLTDLGYPVLEAENGPEAVSMIENVPDIAVVLSDIVMPGGMDGWELARFIKKNRPEIRIVLMSGYAYGCSEKDNEDPELSMLNKPFDVSLLATVLHPIEQ